MEKKQKMSTQTLVMGAVLTALVVILQYMGTFVKFGPFAISLVLIPIVIGTATCGKGVGAWLGFVFGLVVLLSGDAMAFLTVNAPGTIITVLVKGIACGFLAGLAYEGATKLFKGNSYLSAVASAIVCPLVNTGIFLIGCKLFFMDTIATWAGGTDVGHYIIFVLVGGNFVFELLVNIIFSPVIVRIIKAVK
ncbi:MAG: ECF transporter S component [Clostridia bacterium]|nr:ECF transporter S component [Clostridia bacterium]